MHPPVTALYAALLALLYLRLSFAVIRHRRRSQIAIGTKGDVHLERAARVQANFSEYTPIVLLLIYFIEATGYPGWAVHSCGLVLLAARAVHAHGLAQEREDLRFRVTGMVGTFLVLLVSAALLLVAFAQNIFLQITT